MAKKSPRDHQAKVNKWLLRNKIMSVICAYFFKDATCWISVYCVDVDGRLKN